MHQYQCNRNLNIYIKEARYANTSPNPRYQKMGKKKTPAEVLQPLHMKNLGICLRYLMNNLKGQ